MTFGKKARRAGWLLILAVFAFGLVSALRPAPAAAYGLISTRSIKMSSSQVSGSGAGTNVIYHTEFTFATANQSVGSVVMQFCANDPIIGDACTAPSGFNVNASSTLIQNWTASPSGFAKPTVDTTNSTANVLIMTQSPGVVSGTPTIDFDLGNGTTSGVTNPTTLGTFFARIMIFNTNTPDMTSANYQTTEKDATKLNDAGGVALSTATALNVTAKVQEQLTFCVYTQSNCAAGGSAVNMGDSNNVLAAMNTTYLDSTPKFDLASNALGGVVVRLKGDTLKSGSFSIDPAGASCIPDYTDTSHEMFGIRVVSYGAGQYNGDATQASQTPDGGVGDYGCTAGNHKFDVANTNTTYGVPFVTTIGATDVSTSNVELAAKAANTTEAGIYTTTLQFIATATY